MTETASPKRTTTRVLVGLAVTPLALAVGMFTYFMLGMLLVGPFLDGFNSRGEVIPEGTAFTLMLFACVVGTIAAAWALVWRVIR